VALGRIMTAPSGFDPEVMIKAAKIAPRIYYVESRILNAISTIEPILL
jgi:hypothetical protein